MLKGADVILYLNWKPTWTLDADQKALSHDSYAGYLIVD